VVGGEPGACIPSTKARLERMWKAKVADLGGFNESPAGINFSCRKEMEVSHRPMNNHLWEVQGISEALDPKTYEPLPDGKRGIFVWTDLYQESCPLLRFVVGDWIELSHDPCACGRTSVLAVGGLLGRADELINIRGNLIYPSAVEEIVRRKAELGDEYQLIITKKDEMDEIMLVVEVREDVPKEDYPKLEKVLKDVLLFKFDIRVNIDLRHYNTLPRTEMKGQRIIDRR
jgi:phenylacetate-CoA ligase